MKIILKPLFEILTGKVAVCDNVLLNYLIMIIVGEIAFKFAFSLIGGAYDSDLITGRSAGSLLHWIIRLIIYVIVAYIIRGFIWFYEFVVSVPHWVWWSIVGIVVLGMASFIIAKFVRERKKTNE